MPGWTLQMGTNGGVLRNFAMTDGRLSDVNFVKRLNGLGFWSAYIPTLRGHTAPTREEVIRLVYDLGGAAERVHFDGICTEARRDRGTNAYVAKGLGVEGILWRSQAGTVRRYKTLSPFTILTGATGLALVNMQGNAPLAYGVAAAVPNKIEAVNPGVVMDAFIADSGRLLVNIQRLCLQAQYDNVAVPTELRYGLEFLGRLEGANLSTATFYVVRRRERAAAYTPEVWEVDRTLLLAKRGQEGLSAADAVRVVGTGSGIDRVQSAVIGAGGIEGVVPDKTIAGMANAAGNTNAAVMANRLSTLLAPGTEVVTGLAAKHAFSTEVGDLVTVREAGKADASLRVFQIGYRLSTRMFSFVIGRPKAIDQDALMGMDRLGDSHAQGSQIMAGVRVNNGQPIGAANAALANNVALTVTLPFSTRNYDADLDEALQLFWQFTSDPGGVFDIDVTLTGAGAGLDVYKQRFTTPGVEVCRAPLYLGAQFLRDALGVAGTIVSATARVTNRSGVNQNALVQLSGWIQS